MTIHVPVITGPLCHQRNPRTGKPCRRATNHGGRHAFIWRHADPGRVRETWDATCQVCGRPTDGAVCANCGGV